MTGDGPANGDDARVDDAQVDDARVDIDNDDARVGVDTDNGDARIDIDIDIDDGARGVMAETLAALEMPRRGLGRWFAHDRRFCGAHGGARVYGELLELLDRYETALAEAPERER